MKFLIKLAVVGLLLFGLLLGGLVAMIDPLIEEIVTEGIGYTTKQDTTLESASLGILSGDLSFEGLEIANPPGFQETPLLHVARFATEMAPSGIAADRLELDFVELDGLSLALEIKGTESNLTQIVKRLGDLQEQLKRARGVSGEGDTEPDEAPKDELPPEAGPVMKINQIRVTNLSASMRISEIPFAEGVYSFDVPDLLLENFSNDMDQATMVEWTAHVLEEVLVSAVSAADKELPESVRKVLQSDLFKDGILGSALDGDYDRIEDELKVQGKAALDDFLKDPKGDPAAQLDKALDGLFGGKD
ncbi:MAG: hypothetical protein ACI8X5_004057 [Planctomycetota bacterium]|jgi:hypothetical protein